MRQKKDSILINVCDLIHIIDTVLMPPLTD